MTQAILSHTFANGLALVAEPMRNVESAAFTCLVPAGSCYDPADRKGLATLTCELLLRGAGERDSRALMQDLDSLGVERGESVSGAHISFGGATLAENLTKALPIYADILLRPHLPEDQLEPSRMSALQELRALEDEPAQKLMIELRQRQYPDPWGRSSLGEAADLEATTIKDVQQFHAQRFRPNGAILGVAGRIDWPALVDQVGALFADWKPQEAQIVETPRPVTRYEHLNHESNQTQVGISYESVPYRHPDYFQAWGAVGVLSGGMSSRLFTEVREKRGLCYSVYASYHTLREFGSVLCYAGTTAERAQETLDVTLGELRRLADGIEERELDRLKARIKSSLIMQQESSSARSSAIARDWYHLQSVRTLDEVSRIIDELSRESINAYLRRRPPADFTVVTLGSAPLEVR